MIAREGLPFIMLGLALTAIPVWLALRFDSLWLASVAAVMAVLTVWVIFFFRDPERSFEPAPGVLVAPADGKVLAIDTIPNHPFVGGETAKISIFLSVFDVHVNRIPADGRVDYVKYNPGKFFPAFRDKASDMNEQTEIGMITPDGSRLVVKQIAGIIARRIVCRAEEGQSYAAGVRFGMIRFGSRTELFVPVETEIKIRAGDKVRGGETIVGYLKVADNESVIGDETGSKKNIRL